MSLKMLQKAVASGTTSIFATSHLLQAAQNLAWQDFLVGAERLRQLAGEHNLPLAIYSGCEVFIDWDLLDIIAENGSFCLNGDAWDAARVSYILVELPMYFIPNYADDFWYELRLKGVVPILAHPERYTELMAKPDLLLRWRREGLLLQCNIGSFAGSFGAQAEQAAKLRGASVDLSYLQQDSAAYKYNNAKAHWQLLNHNNNGYLYGDGFNAVGTLHISGSLSKDLAVGVTPRFSWDKDEHGDASLVEGYAKTHLGVWGITAGRQPMSWGVGRAGQLAFGSNATPQTAIKLNLLEPHTFDNGALKFLGKANVNVFASRLEGNRVASSGSALEKDHAALVGVRVDIMPTDAFTIGLERMSMLKKFNKHWLLGDNADDAEKDNWNDIAGLDFKYRFPGVQVYASLYGEDQAHAFPCENAYNVGMYFPQLVPDGSWDLRVEAAKTNDAWYGHWVLKNGWTYKDAILGDWLGADAKRVYAEVNHYLADGGKLGLSYTWADMQPTAQHDGRLQEVELSYSKSLQKDLLLHTAVGYGKLGDDTSKLVAVGLSWEY